MFKKENNKNLKNNKRINVIRHIGVLKKAENIAEEVLLKVQEFSSIKGKEFARKTQQFKDELSKGKKLDDILIDAFALAHRAITDIYGIDLYKVQVMGAYALHKGDVSEMKTGEGKTLTAILPAYLNALSSFAGVHIITVNEYLAKRDAFNTGKVFKLLGLKTGVILNEQDKLEKKENYNKDIVYATNSELGFDYLRDNMVRVFTEKVQRGFNYAIVDEVDSILIDEARTPLIISGGSFVEENEYTQADIFVKTLKSEDYEIDYKTKQAFLTEAGVVKAEIFYKLKKLYSNKNALIVHRIVNALQANFIFKFDVDYTVKDDEIVLIDIFTGRLLIGRQFSEGLNQAIEAKENVKIKPETKTLASITYQNLFRMYKKLSGMSGTAVPEEEEFLQVYNMRVLPIPTNEPIIRIDHSDLIFASKQAKIKLIVEEIKRIHKTGQPILVGTRSVSDSEHLANILTKDNIRIEVLNAKNHAREAEIIAKAGEKNSITISTNMAGRGTDIKLGNGVVELGGLFVVGTERHESRRIDDQLRGRSGRQGDIGHSRFFVSLEDEIILRSGMNKFKKYMSSLDNSPIQSRVISRALNVAQKRIEGLNYDQRKSVIEYDDVLNNQRIIFYKQRDNLLKLKSTENFLYETITKFVTFMSIREEVFDHEKFNSVLFIELIRETFNLVSEQLPDKELNLEHSLEYVKHKLIDILKDKFKKLEEKYDFKTKKFLTDVFINSLDINWIDHIDYLAKLKSGIRYRQFAQKNPVQIYVFEAKELFELFKKNFISKGLEIIYKINPENPSQRNKETKELIVN